MRIERIPFVALAILSLIAGILTGLQKIGWMFQFSKATPHHGAIMVGGFLGTLIALEKIIPLKKKSLYAIPAASGASVFLFFLDLPIYSIALLAVSSAALSIVFLIYLVRERSLIYVMMFAGALCWLTGNILLMVHNFYPLALPWWMAFALLIITSERLELMKFLPVSRTQKAIFILTLAIFLVGCLISFHGLGNYLATFSLVTASIWLMHNDVIGINLTKENLTKYIGVALLSGYFALLLCGLFLSFVSRQPLGYDILVHSFFIGFVFSMIFAHGPIILPGVLGISIKPYHPMLYIWLALLHTSWMLRTFADIILDMQLRKYSGIISAMAIAGYFVSLAAITIRQRAKTV
jgi:hypothetical protein